MMLTTVTYDVNDDNIGASHNLVKIGTRIDSVDPCLRKRSLFETLCPPVLSAGLW